MTTRADIAIIGAGMGGYVAALRASQLGAKVALVERDRLGGVCLNWGCIPTKALLRTAEVLRLVKSASEYGVRVEGVRLDWMVAQKRKERVVARLVGGVKTLLDKSGVQFILGTARFVSSTALEVSTGGGKERVEAANYVIATGSRPALLPIPGLADSQLLTSDEALALEAVPASILIVGAGPIGVEFAMLFAACGAKVTLVEVLPRVLPTLDREIGEQIDRELKRSRIKVYTGSKVIAVQALERTASITVRTGHEEIGIEAEKILLAVGRRPNVEDAGLNAAGVSVERKGVVVDERMRTSVPNVYAVGDVTGGMLLAHVAAHEGIVAVENALGGERRIDYTAVPSCVFTWPEVATVGLSEEQAEDRGYQLRVGRFPFRANGKALAYGEYDGQVKIVADARFGKILGVHIVGPHASDMIQEATLALTLEATLDEFEATIHPHPTLTEAVAEAALAARARALHI